MTRSPAIRTVVDGGIHASSEIIKAILKRQAHGFPQTSAQQMDSLSDRELEVFQLIGESITSREGAILVTTSVFSL